MSNAAHEAEGESAFDAFVLGRLHPELRNAGTDLLRRAKTSVVFMLLAIAIAYFFTALNIQFGNYVGALCEGGIASVAAIMCWCFPRFRSLAVVGHIEAFLMSAALLAASYFVGGIDAAALRFLPTIPIMALLLAGPRAAWIWLAVNALSTLAMFLVDAHGSELPPSFHSPEVATWWARWKGSTPLPAPGFRPEKWRELKLSDTVGAMAMALGLASIFETLKNEALRMVEQKNQELAQLFDNMRQAIFTFGRDGRVVGQYSGQARKVFRREELAGVPVLELLFPNAPDYDPEFLAFREWLKIVFDTPIAEWDEMAAMVPPTRVLHEFTEDELFLVVEVRPISKAGRIERVMVLASDETERVRFEREAIEREAEYSKEMAAMKKLLAGGAQLFIAFMQSATDRLDAFERDLGPAPRTINAAEVEVLFQHAHTVKGEARAFELLDLEHVCHGLEENLEDLRPVASQKGFVTTDAYFEELVHGLRSAREEIAKVRRRFVEASPLGEAVLKQTTVNGEDVAMLEREVAGLLAYEIDSPRARRIQSIAERLAARPFGESSGRLQDGVPAWAAQLGKRVDLVIDGREELVPPQLARVLGGCLTHLVRNAIAHGIEAPEERVAAGKDPVGVIKVTCLPGSAGPNILVEDDGRGLDLPRLCAKAAAMGVAVPAGREWELVFLSGVSTADRVDDISGRGVGMAAVKADVEAAGFELDVYSHAPFGTIFYIRHKAASRRTLPPPMAR